MKILITGHSRGIGKSTFGLLEDGKNEIVGMSRSNGHDLEKKYEQFKNKILFYDPDVFINNAYVNNNQTKLLKEIYQEWECKKKLIINICSVAALIPETHSDYIMPYATDKREQRKYCHEKNFMYSKQDFLKTKCSLVNLNFDYTKTTFKSKHDKRLYPNLTCKEVADIISYVIQGYKNNICFREISFHSTRDPELILKAEQ